MTLNNINILIPSQIHISGIDLSPELQTTSLILTVEYLINILGLIYLKQIPSKTTPTYILFYLS